MPSNEDVVNEYLLDAYGLKKQQVDQLETALKLCQEELREVIERYDTTLHTYTDVCRRADRMQAAGDRLRDLVDELVTELEREPSDYIVKQIDEAFEKWGEANV